MRSSERLRASDAKWDLNGIVNDVVDLERDYHLSMEVLSQIVDLTFPDLEVPEPHMARLKRKADDAIKRWKDRMIEDDAGR